jgi:hypothetical protein
VIENVEKRGVLQREVDGVGVDVGDELRLRRIGGELVDDLAAADVVHAHRPELDRGPGTLPARSGGRDAGHAASVRRSARRRKSRPRWRVANPRLD